MAFQKGNHWLEGFGMSIFILNAWLFSSTVRLKGNGGANSGMKQVVMGKLDPVLSGAGVGIGICLRTYNLLICSVPVV